MKKEIILLLITLLTADLAYGQNCNCDDVFIWLKETFENNDAGFQYVIDQKGEDAYKKHTDEYNVKVTAITDKKECAETLANWLRFFRKGHLWFGVNNQQNTDNEKTPIDSAQIKSLYKDSETYPYQEDEFNNYVSTITEPGLEGIWTTSIYTIGVRKVDDAYIGFIISADELYWSKSQVKFKIKNNNGALTATYYMQDHSARELGDISLIGNNHLKMNWIILERVQPMFPSDKSLEMNIEILGTDVPLFKRLNESTTVLRIPSFDGSFRKSIDNLISANHKEITSTANLIIDLRSNGGGSDISYEKILPLIYTNPIKTVGVEFLSTKLNNQRMLDLINDPKYGLNKIEKIEAKRSYKKLESRIGEFVNLSKKDVSVTKYSKVYPFPKNVAIIINEGNGSTTEQFLLAAKQSKKVKLYGSTTAGVLDISNMHFINSPCNDYILGYSLSRSLRLPDFAIDDKGIEPDHYIDKSIPDHEWINYVNKILNNE